MLESLKTKIIALQRKRKAFLLRNRIGYLYDVLRSFDANITQIRGKFSKFGDNADASFSAVEQRENRYGFFAVFNNHTAGKNFPSAFEIVIAHRDFRAAGQIGNFSAFVEKYRVFAKIRQDNLTIHSDESLSY